MSYVKTLGKAGVNFIAGAMQIKIMELEIHKTGLSLKF